MNLIFIIRLGDADTALITGVSLLLDDIETRSRCEIGESGCDVMGTTSFSDVLPVKRILAKVHLRGCVHPLGRDDVRLIIWAPEAGRSKWRNRLREAPIRPLPLNLDESARRDRARLAPDTGGRTMDSMLHTNRIRGDREGPNSGWHHRMRPVARRHNPLTAVAGLALAFVLGACGSTVPPEPVAEYPIDDFPVEAVSAAAREFSMRGDPTFSRNRLNGEARSRYDRLVAEITDPSNNRKIMNYAKSDDVFTYGRILGSHVQVVLIAFRVTGDLILLDHIDEIAEHMRAQLHDSWRGTTDGRDGTKDGFLNWVDRYERSSQFRGKDTTKINEMRAHATVATIAYALHLNRGHRSPSGRNYGAHADFWKDYLVNHFEAKWRQREGIKTAFPFMGRPHTTEYYNWMLWHHYMGKLTGKSGYAAEANRMAGHLWNDLRTVSTPKGTAYVWPQSLGTLGGTNSRILQASTYARHTFGDIVELHLEGFHNWASDEHMRRFARTFSEFIIDTNDPLRNGIASDVGGGVARAGLTSASRRRMGRSVFRDTQFALISPWDDSGAIAKLADGVQDRHVSADTSRLASSLFLYSVHKPKR
jgi:hypothetical protein